MCGLVGVAGNLSQEDVTIFNELLIVNTLRGKHSVGVGSVSSTGTHIGYIKNSCSPRGLIGTEGYGTFANTSMSMIIGHNRHATIGKVNADNAHPFRHGPVIGAHNGTLRSYHEIKDKANSFETDSEHLMFALSKDSAENVIGKISGAWALTWFDQDSQRGFFLRNSERPLFYAVHPTRCVLYWASEKPMLEWILSRDQRTWSGEIREVPVDTLLTFSPTSPWTRERITPQEGGKVTGKKQITTYYSGGYRSLWEDGDYETPYPRNHTSTHSNVLALPTPKKPLVPVPTSLDGTPLTAREWYTLSSDGCCMCGAKAPEWLDGAHTWKDLGEGVVCGDCSATLPKG